MSQYQCDLCGKTFEDRSNLYRHKHKKKPCVAANDNVETFATIRLARNKLEESKNKLEEKVAELEQLLAIKDSIVAIQDSILANGRTTNNIGPNATNATIVNGAAVINNAPVINNLIINNSNFPALPKVIELASYENEKYDHISQRELLDVLSQEDFTKSLSQLAILVYFDSRAAENARWCVTDKHSHLGAVEYKFDSKTLRREQPKNVATDNLRCMLIGMADRFEFLREAHTLTDRQNRNYRQFYGLLGRDDFDAKHLNVMKDTAYDNRKVTQGVWDYLKLRESTTTYVEHVPKKTVKQKVI